MQIFKIDGVLFKTMVVNGAEYLKQNYQKIDALNVFPVPDGDTGTNMRMTIEGGVNEIYSLNEEDIFEVSKKLSRGMLMAPGPWGHSSNCSRHFQGFEGKKAANAVILAQAFASGVKQAYKVHEARRRNDSHRRWEASENAGNFFFKNDNQ